ncbi:hypothetical protein [Actinocorallia libanotica]
MRKRDIGLAAAVAAIVAVPTAAHAGPEDTWRHVYFTQMSWLGDAEAVGPHEVWQVAKKKYSTASEVFHWTGGSTWKGYSLPGVAALQTNDIGDIDVVGPNEAWVAGTYSTSFTIYARYLARWDGTTWTKVSPPTPSVGGTSSILEANAGGVWLAENDRVSRWDGSAWTVTGTLGGGVRELRAFSQGDALARTDGGLWKWDGTAWQKLPGDWPAKAQITGPDSAWYADTDGLHTWDGTTWQTVPYPEGSQDPDAATPISESDGLWVHVDPQSGIDRILRWKDGAWIDYADTPSQVKQVTVDGAGRVWAVERITRYMPSGSSHVPEHKGRLLRLDPGSRYSWNPVSAPEADYRMIELPGGDRLYAYGRNQWTGTDHVTTNAPTP